MHLEELLRIAPLFPLTKLNFISGFLFGLFLIRFGFSRLYITRLGFCSAVKVFGQVSDLEGSNKSIVGAPLLFTVDFTRSVGTLHKSKQSQHYPKGFHIASIRHVQYCSMPINNTMTSRLITIFSSLQKDCSLS